MMHFFWCTLYMGHTSMCQFHTGLSRFWQLLVTIENDDVSTKLIIIFIIELGIWVIRACANFIRGCHVFWQLLVTIENDVIAPKASAEGACIWKEVGYYGACMMGYCGAWRMGYFGIWVIRACANFIRRGDTFQGKWLLQIMMVFQHIWWFSLVYRSY